MIHVYSCILVYIYCLYKLRVYIKVDAANAKILKERKRLRMIKR